MAEWSQRPAAWRPEIASTKEADNLMEPEEMDVIELLENVPVEPGWRIKVEAPAILSRGARGMVIHRHEDMPRYDVEFVDPASKEPYLVAVLRRDQMRVVERYTIEAEDGE
jgi:hypothetical protein